MQGILRAPENEGFMGWTLLHHHHGGHYLVALSSMLYSTQIGSLRNVGPHLQADR